jgi:hypothetical protein
MQYLVCLAINKILLAIDGSESSMAAADYAISITACCDGADLTGVISIRHLS